MLYPFASRQWAKGGIMATANTRDVIVIGGGIFGLSCAWSCLKRGLSVTLLERDDIGAGASGGVMGALSPNVPETWSDKKQFQLDALLSAADHWAEVERVSGMASGYGRIGRILPIMDERGLGHAQKRAEEAPLFWRGAARWELRKSAEFSRWITPKAAPFGMVYETLSARINPRLACLSLAAAIKAKGGDVRTGWQVEYIGAGEISGPQGTLHAKNIILSAGADSFPFLEPYLGADCGFGVKGQAAMLEGADLGAAPLVFADHTYIIPHENGQVAVGSTTENRFDDPVSTDEKLDAVIETARALCPPLRNAAVVKRWANLRPRGKKPDPMLGRVPMADGLLLATGGFKIGLGLSHTIGESLADMVTGNVPDIPEKFFVRLNSKT